MFSLSNKINFRSSKKPKSISEKISELFTVESLADPENDPTDETTARTSEITVDEIDVSHKFSDIRKRNSVLLKDIDQKYRGVVSKRSLDNDSEDGNSEEEEGDSEDEDDSEGNFVKSNKLNYSENGDFDESNSDEDENEDEDDDDDDDGDENSSEDEINSDEEDELIQHDNLLVTNPEESNVNKGVCVKSQLRIWEKMLEMRIHSQKMLLTANSYPSSDYFEKFSSDEKFIEQSNLAAENVESLLGNLLELQSTLISRFSETADLKIRKRKLNNHIADDQLSKKQKFNDYTNVLESNFTEYRPYVHSVVQKWYDRTKTFSTINSKQNKNLSDFNVVKKIENILANKSELIKKTQLYKGGYKLFGDEDDEIPIMNEGDVRENQVYKTEIYDDTDFYHQILRELIEFKTNSLTNPLEISKQYAELQKLRQKMKKKVDTRASKGRKIR